MKFTLATNMKIHTFGRKFTGFPVFFLHLNDNLPKNPTFMPYYVTCKSSYTNTKAYNINFIDPFK